MKKLSFEKQTKKQSISKFEAFKVSEVQENTIVGGQNGLCPRRYGSDSSNCRTVSWDCGETYWTMSEGLDDLS